MKQRPLLPIVVSVLMLGMLVSSAGAFEFSVTGEVNWRYQAYGQRGHSGFFGRYGIDAGAGLNYQIWPQYDRVGGNLWALPGDFAGYNGWLGSQMGDLVTGSGASGQTMFMNMSMEIKVNPAIRVRGQYRVGSLSDTVVIDADVIAGSELQRTFPMPDIRRSEYLNSRYPGVQTAFSPGYWNTLWVTSNLPWGSVSFGKRPFAFGPGMMLNGDENTSTEALTLRVPYGPVGMGLMWYPSRRGSKAYYNPFDDNGKTAWDAATFLTYEAGPLSSGVLGHYTTFRFGPESARYRDDPISLEAYDVIPRVHMYPEDYTQHYGVAFVKFNNGRFFANLEADWFYQKRKASYEPLHTEPWGVPTGALDPKRAAYVEHWRFLAEIGAIAGPAKMSLLYAWVSGPDVRQGQQIDRTGVLPGRSLRTQTPFDWTDVLIYDYQDLLRILPTDNLTNTGVFRPYSLIMVYNFGLGTDVSSQTRNGWVQDASVIAARLDYALAANLNIYGSYIRADRVSNGYQWGYLRPSAKMDGSIDRSNRLTIATDASIIPTIPDTGLGWEADLGLSWKLLEGMTVNSTWGYWKPGRWYSYACIDRAVPDWGIPTAANRWGITPNRTIDPIWGMDLMLTVDF